MLGPSLRMMKNESNPHPPGLQPCLGMRWYDLDSSVARVCTNRARVYSIKQGLSRFEHDLQNDFQTVVVWFQVRSSTVCYGLVRLNTTFTRLTGHLQGLHTFPPTFVRVMLSFLYVLIKKNLLVLMAWLHKFSSFQQKSINMADDHV